jgi:hypothetical protein
MMNEAEQGQHVSTTPTFRAIEGPLPGGKRLILPLIVQIEEDDGEILVSEPHFSMHASGYTIAEAISHFKRVLSEELDLLSADEEKLGPRLQAQLQYLRKAIR